MRVLARLGCFGWLWLAISAFAQTNPPDVLELHVKNVLYLRATDSPVVILMDKDEKRFLPIWIGPGEAQAIAMELYQIKPPRPMTHDLIRSLVHELDGKFEKLTITETKANTYFALLSVSTHGETKAIDCRPSDGIAIALRAKVPIFVSESVMQNAMQLPSEADEEQLHAERFRSLGLTVQTLTPDLAEVLGFSGKSGVLVGGSQLADVHKGDLIVAVGSSPVETLESFARAVEKPGAKEIVLKILRGSQTMTVRVTVPEK